MSPEQYRKERKARGLTQAALAALLGVQRETVVRREAGEVEITLEMALALAALPKTKRRTGTSNTEASERGQ